MIYLTKIAVDITAVDVAVTSDGELSHLDHSGFDSSGYRCDQ